MSTNLPATRLPAIRRRRQLLDVARHEFAARGYHRTSMDEVAEAAGVTKPVLYQHFPSKRALYLELLDDVGTDLLQAILDATTTAGSPRQQVEAGFAAYFRAVAGRGDVFRLLFGGGARRDDEFAEAVRRVEVAIADAVAGLIAADISDDHRRLLAHAIVGMAEGIARQLLASDDDVDPEVVAAQVAELAWAGLRGVGSTSTGFRTVPAHSGRADVESAG